MQDNTPQPTIGKPNTPPTKKDKKWPRVLCILGVILLVVALGITSWLYYDAHQTLQKRDERIEKLLKQIKSLGVKPVDLSPAEDDGAAASNCMGGSSYEADIGNFQITLSNPNVIIRHLDANFEGGPVTNLIVGQCIADHTNVVDNYPTKEVKILANPSQTAAQLRAAFEANWGSPLTLGAPVTVDGVAAQTYTGTGLFNTKVVYFDNAGIGYQIELTDSNATSEAVLTDVISDWNFTP